MPIFDKKLTLESKKVFLAYTHNLTIFLQMFQLRICYFLRVCILFHGLLLMASMIQAKRPNVVFILTDDQRADALSCMGHPHLKTPHIDRLADEGALFKNHFCTTSLCSPSRASILGGLYAHTHGVVNNFTDYPQDLPTFPRQLQAEGYSRIHRKVAHG